MNKWKYFLLALLIYCCAIVSISYVEASDPNANIKSIEDAFWYAIVTLTTVGYGDAYPVTPAGKLISLLLILGSIGVLGFIIGEITSKINQYMDKKKQGFWGTDFEGHYVIIGWNDFGRQVASQIFNTGHKMAFLVNSKDDLDLVKDVFSGDNCFCMFADYGNKEAYKKINLDKAKGVFVNFEEDTETLVFVLNLRKDYPNTDFVVTCTNPSLKETFQNAGIHYVVSQSVVASRLVASYIFEPDVASYTEDLITTSSNKADYDMQQYKVTASSIFNKKNFLEAFTLIKESLNAIAIGVVSDGETKKNPAADYVLKENDYIILISDGYSKKALEEAFGAKEGR